MKKRYKKKKKSKNKEQEQKTKKISTVKRSTVHSQTLPTDLLLILETSSNPVCSASKRGQRTPGSGGGGGVWEKGGGADGVVYVCLYATETN